MKLNPQFALSFNGTCEAAFRCYERCLNGTITFMLTWGNSQSAADAPADWGEKIYHATLKVGTSRPTGTSSPRVSSWYCRWTTHSRRNVSSRNWRKVERSRCPFRRRFGRVASGSWLIGSGYLGQSTANESRKRQHEQSCVVTTRPNARCTRRPLALS